MEPAMTPEEQLAAKDREIAALRKAGEALWVELEDATFGYEGVHWKVQRDAPPVLDAWRALLATPAAEPDDEIRMPMTPGIPGVGVVVSAGPRPDLVLSDEPADAERAARLAAEHERNEDRQQIAALREALRLMYYGSETMSQRQIQEHVRTLLAPAAESVSPCTCRDAASACGACLADDGVPYPRSGPAPSGR